MRWRFRGARLGLGAILAPCVVGAAVGQVAADPPALDEPTVARWSEAVLWLSGGPALPCRATLVAPRLLLTAAGCVSSLPTDPECWPDGLYAEAGALVGPPVQAQTLAVHAEPPDDGEPAALARGARVFMPLRSLVGCSNHLALVQLDRDIPGVAALPIDLRSPVLQGDHLWAFAPGELVEVRATGERDPVLTTSTLFPGVFTVDRPVCPAMRGTPLLQPETGRVAALLGTLRLRGCQEGDSEGRASLLAHNARFIRGVFQELGLDPPARPPRGASPRAPGACTAAGGDRVRREQGRWWQAALLALVACRRSSRRRRRAPPSA